MNALKISLLAAAGCLALAGAARAADTPDVKAAFNIGANNDYRFRGVSQTNNDPSVFGGVDLTIGSIGYAGTWLSNVDFGNGTDFEYDLYAGIKPVVGPVTLDLGVIRYGYAGAPHGSGENYWEAKVGASIPAGPLTLGVVGYYSPDFFSPTNNDKAFYYEANAAVTIPDSKASVSGAIGHQYIEGPGDYTTWNVGLGYAFSDHVGIDLRYYDTNRHSYGKFYDSKFVAGIKVTF
jgi:uncharacterized protein (TIGR02001 family)